MAELEARVDRLEERCTSLEIAVEKVSQKVDLFVEESRMARERQDADMREFRERHDADMREVRESLNNLGGHFRSMNVTVIIGIAAMVIAVLLK